jgi:hypothetical protein
MKHRSRFTIAILVGITVFATAFAAAASLGVTSTGLGAGTATVASCDTNGVVATFDTAYSAPAAGYKVTIVHITGIATPGCDGLSMKVTLVGTADASLAEQTVALATPASDPTNVNFSTDNVSAAAVLKISVVIA